MDLLEAARQAIEDSKETNLRTPHWARAVLMLARREGLTLTEAQAWITRARFNRLPRRSDQSTRDLDGELARFWSDLDA